MKQNRHPTKLKEKMSNIRHSSGCIECYIQKARFMAMVAGKN